MSLDSFVQLPSLIPTDLDGIRLYARTIYAGVLTLPVTLDDIAAKTLYIEGKCLIDEEGNVIGENDNPLNVNNVLSEKILVELMILSRILNESLLPPNRQFNLAQLRQEIII
jgi:hypothetical protein